MARAFGTLAITSTPTPMRRSLACRVFDYNQDGFAQPQQVGLWDVGTSTLLASTYVDNNDPLNGFWRFHGISGVTLVAGREYVVGSQGGEGYTYYTSGMTVAPEITFIEDAWIYLGNSSNDPLFRAQYHGWDRARGGWWILRRKRRIYSRTRNPGAGRSGLARTLWPGTAQVSCIEVEPFHERPEPESGLSFAGNSAP